MYAYSGEIIIIDKLNCTKKGNVFIYSQFKTLEGINTIALVLKTNGYSQFKLGKNNDGEYIQIYDSEDDIFKPKYAIFEGSDT